MSSSDSALRYAAAFAVLAGPLIISCGKATQQTPDSSGGQSGGGGAGAEPFASGGAVGSGGAAGTGGAPDDPDSLQPTADCIHPEVVEDCDGDYCRIEAGCFIMGAPPNEFGRALRDADQVQVTLTRPFLMGRTEVTRAQWARTDLPRPVVHPDNPIRECLEDDCPQGNAISYQMLAYANRLSEMEGLEPCYLVEGDGQGCTGDQLGDDFICPTIKINASSPYECEGYRLPMEAEWEYAARAGTRTSFPTGNITPQSNNSRCFFDAALDEIGWYCENALDQAQPVALKQPNEWGLYDMHGNVMEFVNDAYGPLGYLEGPYGPGEGPLVDPTGVANLPDDITIQQGPDRAYARVIRGGVHIANAVLANVSRRHNGGDNERGPHIGFRVARTIFDSDN